MNRTERALNHALLVYAEVTRWHDPNLISAGLLACLENARRAVVAPTLSLSAI